MSPVWFERSNECKNWSLCTKSVLIMLQKRGKAVQALQPQQLQNAVRVWGLSPSELHKLEMHDDDLTPSVITARNMSDKIEFTTKILHLTSFWCNYSVAVVQLIRADSEVWSKLLDHPSKSDERNLFNKKAETDALQLWKGWYELLITENYAHGDAHQHTAWIKTNLVWLFERRWLTCAGSQRDCGVSGANRAWRYESARLSTDTGGSSTLRLCMPSQIGPKYAVMKSRFTMTLLRLSLISWVLPLEVCRSSLIFLNIIKCILKTEGQTPDCPQHLFDT